ncbi:Glycosyltransferase [Psidium guajava]|nr:Glycosyltransferase [Psidium guajava]
MPDEAKLRAFIGTGRRTPPRRSARPGQKLGSPLQARPAVVGNPDPLSARLATALAFV